MEGPAGDDFFLILPRPPYLNQCFYQNVAEVWKTGLLLTLERHAIK